MRIEIPIDNLSGGPQKHCQRWCQYVVGNTPLAPHSVAIALDDDFTLADSRRAKAPGV